MTTRPWPELADCYVKDLVDLGHREVLLHLDDEEVYHLLIRLEEVDWVLALADEDFCLFAGQEFGIFFVDDGGMAELEGRVHQGQIVGIVLG